jgi:S-adenosylmethionine-diacylglycerol 3-amino-3-carboxypropyl transferase
MKINQAIRLPLAFAQVREDPTQDIRLLSELNQPTRMIMVASGGCTAAYLCQHPNLEHLTLVDCNLAQLGLSSIKLHLLQHYCPEERLAFLGHCPFSHRSTVLKHLCSQLGLPLTLWGDVTLIDAIGLDYAGRYEWLFRQLSDAIDNNEQLSLHLTHLLNLNNPAKQTSYLQKHNYIYCQMQLLLEHYMALDQLVALFGKDATQNPLQSFASHFGQRILWALQNIAANNNPYLWQMLRTSAIHFKNQVPRPVAPWLDLPQQKIHATIKYLHTSMEKALQTQNDVNCIHLSNILDWLSPQQAGNLLKEAHRALAPGGFIIIRQLNSNLDIPPIGHRQGLKWHDDLAASLMQTDRSFFYRQLYIGQKPCK